MSDPDPLPISEADFVATCQTGDILLFHTRHWYSYLIEWFTGSNYSHVAMILRDPTWLHPELKGLFIIESGAEPVKHSTNRYVYGVQVTPLETILEYYRDGNAGGLYYSPLSATRKEDWYTTLHDVIIQVEGCKYDTNVLDWIRAGFHVYVGECHRTNTFWCSALIAYLYVRLGLLDSETPWTMITPRQFSVLESHTLSLHECKLFPERRIQFV